MDYGDVLNDLRNSNNYFNSLFYKNIVSVKKIIKKETSAGNLLTYYNNRKRQKYINLIFMKFYEIRNIISNFKINFNINNRYNISNRFNRVNINNKFNINNRFNK